MNQFKYNPNFNSGSFRNRVTFYKVVKTKDEYGAYHEEEQEVLTVWAMIKTQFMKDVQATIGTILENTLTFIIRHQPQGKITNEMKIKHNNVMYQIVQVNPDLQYQRYDTIIAKAVS